MELPNIVPDHVSAYRVVVFEERPTGNVVLERINSRGEKGAIFFLTVEAAERYVGTAEKRKQDGLALLTIHSLTRHDWEITVGHFLERRGHQCYFEAVEIPTGFRMDTVVVGPPAADDGQHRHGKLST